MNIENLLRTLSFDIDDSLLLLSANFLNSFFMVDIRQANLLYFIIEFKMLTSKSLEGVSCFRELFFQAFLLPIVGFLYSVYHLFLLKLVHFELPLQFGFLDLQIRYFFVLAQSLISVLFEIVFQFLDISLSFLQQVLVLLANSLIQHVIQPGNLLFVSNNLILVH